jgi:hypothetical protein
MMLQFVSQSLQNVTHKITTGGINLRHSLHFSHDIYRKLEAHKTYEASAVQTACGRANSRSGTVEYKVTQFSYYFLAFLLT